MDRIDEFELNKIYCMDCLEGMKKLPDNSVDLVVTDPPFNASNSKMNWKEKSYKSLNEEWDKINDLNKFNLEWITLIVDKLKEGGSIIIYCSQHNILSLMNACSSINQGICMNCGKIEKEHLSGYGHSHRYCNFERPLKKFVLKEIPYLKFRNLLTWFRPDDMPMKRAYLGYFAYSSLWILFYTKGKIKTWNYKRMKELNKGIQMRDCFILKKNSSSRVFHPTQKPLSQIKGFIEILSNPNDIVLDCFMGSGTTAVACKQLGRNFIGFEINPEYVKIANKRLAQEVLI